jgi:hypothetical protein
MSIRVLAFTSAFFVLLTCATAQAPAPTPPEPPEFPPAADILKGLDKVVTGAGEQAPMYTLYKRDKDARLVAELSRGYENQKIFIATTIAGGATNTGIQLAELYAYWKRYDKKLALIEPNVSTRSNGDADSKRTEERVFTDRVVLDTQILGMGPNGSPMIDLTSLLTGQADKFFGWTTMGANRSLVKLVKAKAFPQNIEIAYELPDRTGKLLTIHYSISLIPAAGSYQPREADPRVGYFTTAYRDVSRNDKDTQWVRYINRWNLVKRDPKLKVSPPKEPIVFYIESSVPVAYRKYVREGLLDWNKAFEKIGFDNAIEVYQQDAQSGTHMDKDPEDVRYNFVRWTSAGLGFAIGPSRVHPETGQILDADIVIDDGFIRSWVREYQQLLPEVAMLSYGPETISWLDKNPQWDPRVRMAPPGERDLIVQQRMMHQAAMAQEAFKQVREGQIRPGDEVPMLALRSGEPLLFGMGAPLGPRTTPDARYARCAAMLGKSIDVSTMRLMLDAMPGLLGAELIAAADDKPEGEKKKDEKKEEKEPLLDGLPEWFVGPLIKDLVAHESGHTLGLRHNFKASTIYTLKEMNTPGFKGNKTITASVMDYTPLNINFRDGDQQGDYCMTGIGLYDMFAIEYGYTTDNSALKSIIARASTDPLIPYGTDEDSASSDPYIRRFDLGKDPLDYADSTMRLVTHLRTRILDRVVKDGDPWQRARQAYELTLALHTRALGVSGDFLGGNITNRDRKGDAGKRDPIKPIDAATQRRALKFLVENAFRDDAFGLTRELLSKASVEKWYDEGGMRTLSQDQAWPIHDRILGLQSSALTMAMNPTTLQRVYDSEYFIEPGADALTLAELLDTVTGEIFSELANLKGGTARNPSISSLRRNLQRETLNRLIDLSLPDAGYGAAYKPISNLVVAKLRDLKSRIDQGVGNSGLDPYTRAHLGEASIRIGKALDAQYIYNQSSGGFGGMFGMFFGQPVPSAKPEAANQQP